MTARRPALARRTEKLELSGIRRVMELASAMTDVIRLEVGEPDFATPDYILEAVKSDLDSGRYTHYTPMAGFPELRRALAAKFEQDNGITADALTEVLVSPGGASSLYYGIMATVDPGNEVLIPDPGYPQYTQQTLLAAGVPVYYPLREENGFQPDMDELRGLVTPQTKMLILNSPHNPTGSVLSKASLERVTALAEEHDLIILADEVYSTLVYGGERHHSIAALPGMFERTITVNTLSKSYAMTGWRLGYAAARRDIMWEMIKIQSFINTCPSSVSQRAALAALKRSAESKAMTAEYARRRAWLVSAVSALPGFRCPVPQGAFYVFPNISSYGLTAAQFSERLLELSHVTSVPGTAFGPTGEGHIRLSYATSLEILQTAVDRISAALPRMKT